MLLRSSVEEVGSCSLQPRTVTNGWQGLGDVCKGSNRHKISEMRSKLKRDSGRESISGQESVYVECSECYLDPCSYAVTSQSWQMVRQHGLRLRKQARVCAGAAAFLSVLETKGLACQSSQC